MNDSNYLSWRPVSDVEDAKNTGNDIEVICGNRLDTLRIVKYENGLWIRYGQRFHLLNLNEFTHWRYFNGPENI